MARTVGTRELKTRLGTYLRIVRSGKTLVVTDRGRPVAELRPIPPSKDRRRAVLEEMAAEGLITLPAEKGPLPRPRPVRLRSGPPISQTVIEEREEGY